MLLKVRDALQKQCRMSHGDVIEQHQVLMNLPHIADMRNYGQPKLAGQKAHGKKLGDTGHAGAVHLHKMHGAGLHEILEHDAIGDVFTKSNG